MPKLGTPLTNAKIESHLAAVRATPRGARPALCDGGQLYLVPSAARPTRGQRMTAAWEVRFRSPVTGKRSSVALGEWPSMGIADARKARDAELVTVSAGLDPALERKRTASSEVLTLEGAARAWDAQRATLREVDERTRRDALARLARHVFPTLGARPLASLTREDLRATLETLVKAGTAEEAKRTRTVLGQVFEWAEARGIVESNPAHALRKAFRSPKPKHHPAIIEPHAFGTLLRALDDWDGGHAQTRAALRFLALVFVRSRELRGARWVEIDLDTATWIVPAERMKISANGAHTVPLSKQAVTILRDLHEVTGRGPLVFPGLRPGKPLSDMTLGAALATLGYKGIHTPHGFRSSASSLLREMASRERWRGVFDRDHIELQLAHGSTDKVHSAYQRSSLIDARRAMMQAWADECDAMKERRP